MAKDQLNYARLHLEYKISVTQVCLTAALDLELVLGNHFHMLCFFHMLFLYIYFVYYFTILLFHYLLRHMQQLLN